HKLSYITFLSFICTCVHLGCLSSLALFCAGHENVTVCTHTHTHTHTDTQTRTHTHTHTLVCGGKPLTHNILHSQYTYHLSAFTHSRPIQHTHTHTHTHTRTHARTHTHTHTHTH